MGYQGINHVTLVVTDTDGAARFYQKALGLESHPRESSWFRAGDCGIHLVTRPRARWNRSAFRRLQHPALQVDDRRPVLKRLLEASYRPFEFDFEFNQHPIASEDADLVVGNGSIFVRDDDGNLFEIMEAHQPYFAGEPDPFTGR